MRKGCALAALTCAALFAVAACGSSGSGSGGTFVPRGSTAGGASPQGTASSGTSLTMPPFGRNVHVVMTKWMPPNAGQAQAVLVDKDYELAYLYAEYTSGQDDGWTSYVTPTMQTEVRSALSQQDITTESFTGTIRFFDMSVLPDPTVRGDLDVSACFDNAQSSNTNKRTGRVIPGNVPPGQHFYRYTDQLTKDGSGSWKVTSDLPPIYYPRARECKP